MSITRVSSFFLMTILLTSTISASLIGDNFWIKEAYATDAIYAITWNNGAGGSVRTYTISADGLTLTPLSAEVEFEADFYVNGAVKKMDSDTWFAAYRGTGNDLEVTTFEIDSAGAITIKSTLNVDDDANYVSVQKRDDDTAVVVSSLNTATGPISVKTFTIGSDSSITAVATQTVADTVNDFNNFESFQVDTNTFGVIGDELGTQIMRTFDVSADGATIDNFGNTPLSPTHTGSPVNTQEVISIDADTFVFTFKDASNTGSLKTVDISSSGAITTAGGTETKVFDAGTIGDSTGQMFSIGNNIFGIAYPGVGNDGFLKTVSIADDGNIVDTGAATVIGTLEFADATTTTEPNIINVNGDVFAFVYADGTGGELDTIDINADGTIGGALSSLTIDTTGSTFDIFLVAAATTTTRSNSGDSTAPTLGSSSTGQKLIDNGFVYNDNPIDVKNFKTHYPLVRTPVGEPNTLDLKIFENQGMNALKFVSVHFGVPQIHAQGEAIITFYPGTEVMKVYDPNNLLGDVEVDLKPVKCKDDSQKIQCVNVSLDHTFNEAPLHDIIRVTVTDKKLNHADVFFNDGVEVFGDSLNPANTAQIAAQGKDRGIIELTQTDRAQEIWVDQYDNTWNKNSMGNFIMQPLDEFTHPDYNLISENGYKRIHSHFDTYKTGQELIAKQIWNGILIQSELPESFETPAYGAILGDDYLTLRINDSALQKDMLKQIERASQKLNAPNTSLEDYGIFIVYSSESIIIPDEILFIKDYSEIKDKKLSEIENALNLHDKKFYDNKRSD